MSDPTPELPVTLTVPASTMIDIAIETWRLGRWLAARPPDDGSAARYVWRRLTGKLHDLEFETIDLTGQRYEPGLALEVIGSAGDGADAGDPIVVDEMVAPICVWRGKVVRHGQVVTRSSKLHEDAT